MVNGSILIEWLYYYPSGRVREIHGRCWPSELFCCMWLLFIHQFVILYFIHYCDRPFHLWLSFLLWICDLHSKYCPYRLVRFDSHHGRSLVYFLSFYIYQKMFHFAPYHRPRPCSIRCACPALDTPPPLLQSGRTVCHRRRSKSMHWPAPNPRPLSPLYPLPICPTHSSPSWPFSFVIAVPNGFPLVCMQSLASFSSYICGDESKRPTFDDSAHHFPKISTIFRFNLSN